MFLFMELRTYCKKRTVINYQYTLHGKVLKEVRKAKYLGVHMPNDLNWNHHIGKVTSKANRTLGFVRRNLLVKSRLLKERAYFTLVRPHAAWIQKQYLGPKKWCRERWKPQNWNVPAKGSEMDDRESRSTSKGDQHALGSWLAIPRREACRHGLTPARHSCKLRLPTRRSRQIHKHSFLPLPCHTTSHQLSLFRAFFPRTISQWNSLPIHVFTNCNSADQFRKRISALNHASDNLL